MRTTTPYAWFSSIGFLRRLSVCKTELETEPEPMSVFDRANWNLTFPVYICNEGKVDNIQQPSIEHYSYSDPIKSYLFEGLDPSKALGSLYSGISSTSINSPCIELHGQKGSHNRNVRLTLIPRLAQQHKSTLYSNTRL
ncbi:MAG: hypothetical protein AAFY71_17110 [Bacteroidota bacterium]